MKKLYSSFLFLSFFILTSQAQWSNTGNLFTDSLHMPVTQAPKDQQHPIVLKSYPDSGYFVIWEDGRNAGNGFDIYAQKYDKSGKALWTKDGVAVVAGVDNQLLAPSSNADYRYINHAATDSTGGFYVVWDDANETGSHSTARHRVCAQHILSNGTARFPYPGFIVAQPEANAGYGVGYPQLIADGNKGCYISYYVTGDYGQRDLFVYCYRDENGTMKQFGGGQADFYAQEQISNTQCGVNTKSDLVYPDAGVSGYHIYPDLQGGCNILFTYDLNAGGSERTRIGFNRLCRIKKDSHVIVRRRQDDIAESQIFTYDYKKDDVVMLYQLKTFFNKESCRLIDGTIIAYTNYFVENFGQGFLNLSDSAYYNLEYIKGVMARTSGNININVVATSRRNLTSTNGISDWYKEVFFRSEEVYDSIPYQLTTDTSNPYLAYNIYAPKGLNKMNYGSDTLLAAGVYDNDFTLSASNSRIFASGMVQTHDLASPRYVALQQLQVDRITADSFAVHFATTSKQGIEIGKELNTGFTGTDINYDNPLITCDERGNAVYTITETGRYPRISPIADSARLVWGPMGKPIGTGVFNSNYYTVHTPHLAISPADGTADIAWSDARYTPGTTTGENIYMRHLDSLNFYNYLPPVQTLSTMSNGGTLAFPNVLLGLSKNWNFFDGYNGTTGIVSTMVGVYDNFNLGAVITYALDHVNADGKSIRSYNGIPYLDRNYQINVENDPKGSANINVRLFFTTAQFVALQTADPTIHTPADLIVIKQPKTGTYIPGAYTPVSGEQLIVPTAWKAVSGGYYIEFGVTGFSDFFIKKNKGLLPVTWLDVKAERKASNTASVKWTVANETNVKNYLVQYSEDGMHYQEGCTVLASGLSSYSCVINADNNKTYYFKIRETDFDGRSNESKTVWLDKLQQALQFTVSPNPVQSDAVLMYRLPTAEEAILQLSNALGATLWEQHKLMTTSGTITIPMNKISTGTYYLRITTSKTVKTIKILKQ